MPRTRGEQYVSLDEPDNCIVIRDTVTGGVLIRLSLAAAEDLAEAITFQAEAGRERAKQCHSHQ